MQIIFVSGQFGRIDLTERVSSWNFATRDGVGFLDASFRVSGSEHDLYPLVSAIGADRVEFWAYGERVWWGYFAGPRLAGRGLLANQLTVRAEGAGQRLKDGEVWRVFSDVEYGRWSPAATLPAGFGADNNNRVYVGAKGALNDEDSGSVTYPETGVVLGAGLVRLRARALVVITSGSFEARIEDGDGATLWSTTSNHDADIDLTLSSVDGLALVLECTVTGDSEGYARLTELRVQTLANCTPDAISGAILDDEGVDYNAEASDVDVDAAVYQGETPLRVIQDMAYLGNGEESWRFVLYDDAEFAPWVESETAQVARRDLPGWEIEYRRDDVINAVRVELPDGWRSDWVENEESIAQWGRREKTLALEKMARTLAEQYAAIYLEENAWPIAGIKLESGAMVQRSDGSPWPAVLLRAGDVLKLRDLIPGDPRIVRIYETEAGADGVRITPQGAINRIEYLLATQKRETDVATATASSGMVGATSGGSAGGDMLKATYDPDDDGTVNNADYAATAGDADTLDGNDSSAFEAAGTATAAVAAHAGVASAHHSRYTDGEAVAAILAADGTGSGLDADLLDGQHASAFEAAGTAAAAVAAHAGNASAHHAPITLAVGSSTALTLSGQELTLADYFNQSVKTTASPTFANAIITTGGYVGVTGDVRTVYNSASGLIIETLGDAAGADEWRVVDSAGTAGVGVDSDGLLYTILQVEFQAGMAAYNAASNPHIYRTNGAGGAFPFNQTGNLVLEPRADGTPRSIVFATGNAPTYAMIVSSGNDILIGTATAPTGTHGKVLAFGDNGGDPTAGVSTAGFYAKTVSSVVEAFAFDSASNNAQLTPHNYEGPVKPIRGTLHWSQYHRNDSAGVEKWYDMERALLALEVLSGKKFIYERRIRRKRMPARAPRWLKSIS